MRIPKSRMKTILRSLDLILVGKPEFFNEEELELLRRLYDEASKCHHGDGTALDVEVFYGGH